MIVIAAAGEDVFCKSVAKQIGVRAKSNPLQRATNVQTDIH